MTAKEGGSTLDRVIDTVERALTDLYGADGFYHWGDQAFLRIESGAVVLLLATPLEDDAVLNVRCYVVRGPVNADTELGDFLVRVNSGLLFGGFSIDDDGDVCFDYSVLGSAVTVDAVRTAVRVVAEAAVRYAPVIIGRWGGMTSLDKLREEIEVDSGEEPTH